MSEERQTGQHCRPANGDGSAETEPLLPMAEASDAAGVACLSAPAGGPSTTGPQSRIARHRQRLLAWWRMASPNLRGSVYMLSALLVYAVMVGAIKHVGGLIPLVQILLIRQIIMSLLILGFSAGGIRSMLRTRRPALQIVRSGLTLAAMLCGFTAVIRIPLAQATAIGFSQVLFVTIAAVIILKEVVDARRWAATALGFLGVLIMLRPSGDGLDAYALLAVVGAVLNAGITVSVRMLASTERTDTILIWQGMVMITALALPAWLWWVPPDAAAVVLAHRVEPVRHGRAMADHPRLSGRRSGCVGAARFQPPDPGELHRLRLLRRGSGTLNLDRCGHRHRRDALHHPQERAPFPREPAST